MNMYIEFDEWFNIPAVSPQFQLHLTVFLFLSITENDAIIIVEIDSQSDLNFIEKIWNKIISSQVMFLDWF